MQGRSRLVLNESTIVQALQHYCDTFLFATAQSPLVAGVDQGAESGSKLFSVSLRERSRFQ